MNHPLLACKAAALLLILGAAAPSQLGTLVLPAGTGDDPRGVHDIGNGHVVISNQVDGWQHFVKVSNPSSPTLTTSLNPPYGDQWFEAEYTPDYGGRLFTAHRSVGLNMIDVSNPSSPAVLASFGSGYHFRGLRYARNGANGVLYYNATNQGLEVYDVLANATVLSAGWNNFGPGNDGNGMEIMGNRLYQLGMPPTNPTTRLLKEFDVTLPQTPVQCFQQTLTAQQNGNGHAQIRRSGLFGVPRMIACRWNDGLEMIDATNPCNPTITPMFPSVFGPLLITYWGSAPIPGSPVVIVYCSLIVNNNPTPRFHFWWPWTVPANGSPIPGTPFQVPLYTKDMQVQSTGRAYVVGTHAVTQQGMLWVF